MNANYMSDISFSTPESVEEKLIAANLVMQSLPEFYKLFSLKKEIILKHISSEFFSGKSEVSDIKCIIKDSKVIAIISYLSSTDLKILQIMSVQKLLSMTDSQDKNHVKQRLRHHLESVQPIQDDYFYLSRIAVLSEYRGKKLGQEALKYFIKLGSSYQKLALHVNKENKPAISMYSRAGFEFSDESSYWDYPLMIKSN